MAENIIQKSLQVQPVEIVETSNTEQEPIVDKKRKFEEIEAYPVVTNIKVEVSSSWHG